MRAHASTCLSKSLRWWKQRCMVWRQSRNWANITTTNLKWIVDSGVVAHPCCWRFTTPEISTFPDRHHNWTNGVASYLSVGRFTTCHLWCFVSVLFVWRKLVGVSHFDKVNVFISTTKGRWWQLIRVTNKMQPNTGGINSWMRCDVSGVVACLRTIIPLFCARN